jgi:hypothetical protein
MSVRLYVRNPLSLDWFSRNLMYFSQICPENLKFYCPVTIITHTLHEDQYSFSKISPSLPRMRNVSDKTVKKIKTHILCSVTFFSPPKIVEKKWWSRAGHRWKYGTCALHSEYTRLQKTLRICNTFYFFTATLVTRTPLNVTLHGHCFFNILQEIFIFNWTNL